MHGRIHSMEGEKRGGKEIMRGRVFTCTCTCTCTCIIKHGESEVGEEVCTLIPRVLLIQTQRSLQRWAARKLNKRARDMYLHAHIPIMHGNQRWGGGGGGGGGGHKGTWVQDDALFRDIIATNTSRLQ